MRHVSLPLTTYIIAEDTHLKMREGRKKKFAGERSILLSLSFGSRNKESANSSTSRGHRNEIFVQLSPIRGGVVSYTLAGGGFKFTLNCTIKGTN